MWNASFYILIVIVAVWGILTGYRKGLMRQTGGVLGVAFGIVAARMLGPEFMETVDGWIPAFINGFNRQFLCETLSFGLIYIIVSGLVEVCTLPLGKLMSLITIGILDSIGGAVFRLFQLLMIISIVYNFLADLSPESDLTRTSSRHDGNIVEGVMMIAPPILGFQGAEEVAFQQQMEDAKKIS